MSIVEVLTRDSHPLYPCRFPCFVYKVRSIFLHIETRRLVVDTFRKHLPDVEISDLVHWYKSHWNPMSTYREKQRKRQQDTLLDN